MTLFFPGALAVSNFALPTEENSICYHLGDYKRDGGTRPIYISASNATCTSGACYLTCCFDVRGTKRNMYVKCYECCPTPELGPM